MAADGAARGIEIDGVAKSFAGNRAVDDVSLSVAPGEFLALLGPSGCGKTTLLRAVAGLIEPDQGTIKLAGTTVVDVSKGRSLAPERRGVGMVFQDYALWPHLRARENVGFPLAARGVPAADRPALIAAALRRVGLEHRAEAFPEQLSGGQQQRVGLARAIVYVPKVLLFDEPLSNLDAALRGMLGQEIVRLARELGAAALYVTHDQEEALSLSDRIAVMRAGRILCADTPESLYRNPPSAWVAGFLRSGSLVPGKVLGNSFVAAGTDGSFALEMPGAVPAGPATLMVPGAALRLTAEGADLDLLIVAAQFKGDHYEIAARLGPSEGSPSLCFNHDHAIRPGERVPVSFDRARLRLFTGNADGPA